MDRPGHVTPAHAQISRGHGRYGTYDQAITTTPSARTQRVSPNGIAVSSISKKLRPAPGGERVAVKCINALAFICPSLPGYSPPSAIDRRGSIHRVRPRGHSERP